MVKPSMCIYLYSCFLLSFISLCCRNNKGQKRKREHIKHIGIPPHNMPQPKLSWWFLVLDVEVKNSISRSWLSKMKLLLCQFENCVFIQNDSNKLILYFLHHFHGKKFFLVSIRFGHGNTDSATSSHCNAIKWKYTNFNLLLLTYL